MAERELFPSEKHYSNQEESKVTDDIREGVNVILDCIDYVCDKFQISNEEQQKALNYIMDEIVVPGVAMRIAEKVKNFIAEIETETSENENEQIPCNYGSPYRVNHDNSRQRVDYSSMKTVSDISKLIFSTKDQAELVVTKLQDYINEYGYATVGYLYELLGEFCSYTAEYYGWKDSLIDRYEIVPDRKGYRLILPNPVCLE